MMMIQLPESNSNQLSKSMGFDDIITFKTMKNEIANILYVIKYESEICYLGMGYDADFGYGIETRINCQNRSNLMMS